MNSTASLRRTDVAAAAAQATAARVAMWIATAMFSVVMISFRPFQPEGPASTGGDIVNQLGYGALGGLAIFCLATLVDAKRIPALLSPWWLLLLSLFMLSVYNATDPSGAMRTASFTLIGIITMSAILLLPRDAEAFSTVLATTGLLVVGVCYAGLFLFPNEALHTVNSLEPQHAGFWRGVFTHKNIAGPVMAGFSFGGIYLWRRGWRWLGIVLFTLSMVFLANTGSKTTSGLVPLAILIVVLPSLVGMRLLTPILFAAAVIGTAVATLGIVFIGPVKDFAAAVAPDLTYTGRTALWEFSGGMIAQRPWTGYGYESFWQTPFLTGMDRNFDDAWDIRGIVHGHNGYMDIAVLMGLPTLAAAVAAFLLEPLRNYMRIPLRRENIIMGDFFMMVALFTLLNAFLESFFFRRADPVWLMFVFSALGLRLVSRFPIYGKDGR